MGNLLLNSLEIRNFRALHDLNSSGTMVRQADKSPVGLWLMPDNTLAGMLEDFASLLVPYGDVLWPIAEHVLQEIVTKERRFPEAHYSEARIHT